MKNIFGLLFLGLMLISTNAYSQDFIDTEGKDFWLTFLPNYHNDKEPNRTDSLNIFISSKVPTKGVITYRSSNGQVFTRNFVISNPSQIYSFAVTHYNFELTGFNDSGNLLMGGAQCEIPSPNSFHVVCDDEVTVYALNQASLTSEAFLVIPTDALGTDYYILTYNSDGGNSFSGQSTPSQFAIVASEDNTTVTVKPSAPTFKNALNTRTVLLQKGEVYLVQAAISQTNLNGDLTGSFVQSDKPIAVFAGHQRSALPIRTIPNASRDCLVEQMIPITSWGRNAIVVPFEQPTQIASGGSDIFRVLAANDNTEVKFDGTTYNLNSGQFLESSINKAMYVESNEPILVAQYKKSAKSNNIPDNYSDPLMLLVPPVEQYATSYRVINAQGQSRSTTSGNLIKAYDVQYITVVGDRLAIENLVVDGLEVITDIFKQVENTPYYWANLRMSDGVHTLNSIGKFAVFVYGFGSANSYGYLGGMSLAVLDLVGPRIFSNIKCFKAEVVVADSSLTDSKIGQITSKDLVNTKVNIPSFTPYQAIVKFEAELVNKYLDGEFTIVAIDSVGLESEKKFEIPGFTIGLDTKYDPIVPTYSYDFPIVTESCFEVVITNYGKHIQQIGTIKLKNTDFILTTPQTPFLLAPGASKVVTFCGKSDFNKQLKDTLIIGDDCTDRDAAYFNIVFKNDTLAPRLASVSDTCNRSFKYTFIEDSPFDFGIENFMIIKSENCEITSGIRDLEKLEINVEVLDSYQDAEFEIIVYDKAGLETNISRVIPGFTLSFASYDQEKKEFDSTQIGRLNCETIDLTNYGNYPIILDNLFLSFNTIFSIPQSQKPFEIAPGETRKLDVCFAPYNSKDEMIFDTLNITMNCLLKKLPIMGKPLQLNFTSNSLCDVLVTFKTDSIHNGVSIRPNPAIDIAEINISLPQENSAKVFLFNSIGELVAVLFESDEARGNISIRLNTKDLSNGIYFLKTILKDEIISKPLMINK